MTEVTTDFAISYLLDECYDCPENKDGECMTQSHCFEVKQMAIKALEQESCDDCISRQAVDTLVDELARAISDERCCMPRGRSTATIMQDILDLPSVTPQPKIGHWIKTPKAVMGEGYMWYCDKCEYQVYQDSSRPYPSERYCPNCGCRMVEPQESEDKCKNCEYYHNPDYTRCHKCKAESEDK